jgi:hypothetical protein
MEKDLFDFKRIAKKVHSILSEHPEARDDDRILLSLIWAEETSFMSSTSFLTELMEGKITTPETITRMRRKIQEKHEPLRGDKWKIRHQMEAVVCQQLTFFDKW